MNLQIVLFFHSGQRFVISKMNKHIDSYKLTSKLYILYFVGLTLDGLKNMLEGYL